MKANIIPLVGKAIGALSLIESYPFLHGEISAFNFIIFAVMAVVGVLIIEIAVRAERTT